MSTKKAPAPVDTSAGTTALNLANQYNAAVGPRLPAGMLDTLAADLTTLGAILAPATPAAPPPAPGTPAVPPAPPPTLAEAVATLAILLTAVHASIEGSKAKAAIRKAYAVSSKAVKEPARVLAAAQTVVTRADQSPTEALSLGILPADVAALSAAIAALTAAEVVVKGSKGGGATAKERQAAEVRMHEAVARISGAGVLAFATNAPVRAEFAALAVKKKKA
jgi:hypothetical protein